VVGIREIRFSGKGGLSLQFEFLEQLDDVFNEEELRELCLKLDIDYDNLDAKGKRGKARELILYCKRHGRTADLVATCAQLRFHLDWSKYMEL
jgi:hypothetical protein